MSSEAQRLRDEANEVFDAKGSETPQIVRDVIEWFYSSLLVAQQAEGGTAQPAAPAGDVVEFERWWDAQSKDRTCNEHDKAWARLGWTSRLLATPPAPAVAEPVVEVRTMMTGGNAGIATYFHRLTDDDLPSGTKLYTAQPAGEREPLTVESCQCGYPMPCSKNVPINFCRAGITPKEPTNG